MNGKHVELVNVGNIAGAVPQIKTFTDKTFLDLAGLWKNESASR